MSNTPRRSLSDIVNGSGRDDLARLFDEAEAATDMATLPAGKYRCRVTDGEPMKSKSGTPGYQLTFVVDEGEHKGRRIWHTCWLTQTAMSWAKRDLMKLGITSAEMLEQPLPSGIVCEVKVALRADDDGTERTRVVRFDVVAVLVDPTADDDFGAPAVAPPAVTKPAPAAPPPTLAQAEAPAPAPVPKQPAVGKYLPGQKTPSIMDEPKAKGGAA